MLTSIQHRKQIFSSAFSNLLLILVILLGPIFDNHNKMLNFPPSSSLIRVSSSSDEKIPYYAEGLGNRGPGPKKRKRLTHLTEEEKVMRRKWKNRQAAQSARDRKKQKMEELEQSNYELKHTSQRLLQLNQGLVGAIKALQEKVEQLSNKLGLQEVEQVADIKHFEQEMHDIMEKKYQENTTEDAPEIKEEAEIPRKVMKVSPSPVTIRRPIATRPTMQNHPTNHKPVIITSVQSPSTNITSNLKIFAPSTNQNALRVGTLQSPGKQGGSPEPAVSRGHFVSQQQKEPIASPATKQEQVHSEELEDSRDCKEIAEGKIIKLEVKEEWDCHPATGGPPARYLRRVVPREALERLLKAQKARRSSSTSAPMQGTHGKGTSRYSSATRNQGSSCPCSAPARRSGSCCRTARKILQLREIPSNLPLQCPPLVKPIKVEREY